MTLLVGSKRQFRNCTQARARCFDASILMQLYDQIHLKMMGLTSRQSQRVSS